MSLLMRAINILTSDLPPLPPGMNSSLCGVDHDRTIQLRRLVYIGAQASGADPLDLALAVAHVSTLAYRAGARMNELEGALVFGSRGNGS